MQRARRWASAARYGLAAVLGLSLLGMTYVLFDPDLDTEVPLFQELTCRGKIDVEVTNGFHEPFLRVPYSAVHYRGTIDGALVPVHVRIETREAGGAWTDLQRLADQRGEGFYYVPTTTPSTQLRVTLTPLEHDVCRATSDVLAAREGPYEEPAAPEGTQ